MLFLFFSLSQAAPSPHTFLTLIRRWKRVKREEGGQKKEGAQPFRHLIGHALDIGCLSLGGRERW
jgi:hypothetical protein